MRIFSAEQMRAWDSYTIQYESISSLDLMERAAGKCVDWLRAKPWQQRSFKIFCGRGNNGGDGLAIARLLNEAGYDVRVFILQGDRMGSANFESNLKRLSEQANVLIQYIEPDADLPMLAADDVTVDALFGTGLNKPLQDVAATLTGHLNESGATIVSIDLPSGLSLEHSSLNQPVVKADYTLTFQAQKKALLLQENAPYVGEVVVLDIGLSPSYAASLSAKEIYLDRAIIRKLFKLRQRFSHKGTFGHAAIIAGGWGKMGAAVLAANACLRTGAGLTTAMIPKCGYDILQTTLPEVMVMTDEDEKELTKLPDELEKLTAIGIGPGTGSSKKTIELISDLFRRYRKPIVIDADGLNCLAKSPGLLQSLPSHSILTPHPKEFERLFGEHSDDFKRTATALTKAKELNVIIVLKGHHTLIALPDGRRLYNSTGNAGMAKGGSGDVLTGMITSLLAQGYAPADAALVGVYIHGWAGDIAAKKFSKQAMTPGDLIACLGDVFLELENPASAVIT